MGKRKKGYLMPLLKCVTVAIMLVVAGACSRDPNVRKQKYVESGNRYFDKAQYRQASIMYRKALQVDQRYGLAHYRMGLTALRMAQGTGAVQSFRRAAELLPSETVEARDAKIKLSEMYLAYLETNPYQRELVAEIGTTVEELLKGDPKSFDGLRLRARLLFVETQNITAHKLPGDPEAALAKAIEAFRQANAIRPNEPETVVYLARCLSVAKKYDEADKLYRDLVQQHKDRIDVYLERHRLAMFQNRPEQGEAILKEAIQNNPKAHRLLINLAVHYYGQRRRDDVVKTVQQLKSKAKEYPEAYEMAGLFYFRLGDGSEAIRQYEEGIQNDPANKNKYRKFIVEVLMAQGKKEEARKLNDDILKDNPKDADAMSLQASLLLDKGEVQAAVNQLQSVVIRSPTNFVAVYNLGRGLMEKGDVEQARQKFQEAIRLKPDYMAPRLALSQIQLARREFDAAMKNSEEMLALDANNAGAALVRTAALMGLGQNQKAREELGKLLDRNPSSQDALFQFGLINVIERKYKEAEAAYRKCYDLNPGNSRGLMGQVEAIMAQSEPDRAMQVLQTEMQKFPNRMEFRVALANVAVRAGKPEKAISEYRWLLDRLDKKSPQAADILFRLAAVQRARKDAPGAIDSLQRAREIVPNNAMVANALATALDDAGRKKEAKDMYEQTLRLNSEDPIALNNLAFLIASTPGGDLDQALTLAQRAKQKLPQVAEVADTLGMIYLKKNLPDNAIEIFRDCVTKVPKHPTYRMHLAMALFQKGDKIRAREEAKQALASKPFTKEDEDSLKSLLQRIGG